MRACSPILTVTLTAIGLAACEPSAPPVSPAPETEAIPPGETLTDVVRDALDDILQDDDPYSRARRLGALLPTLGPELVPAVKQLLGDPLRDYRAVDLELLLHYWATHQPKKAAFWAKEEAPLDHRPVAVYSALRRWAEADPQAASDATWRWAVTDPELARVVPIAQVRGWYAADQPDQLTRWMRDLHPGLPRQRTLAAYARVVLEKDGAEALQRWAESLPSGEEGDADDGFKTAAFGRATVVLADLDVEGAKRWCEKHCDEPYGKDMRNVIGIRWVWHDPQGALEWLVSEPHTYHRDRALRGAGFAWVRLDPGAARAWMEEQLEGGPVPHLEPLYVPYVQVLLKAGEPHLAIEWASRVEKEQERRGLQIRVVRAWRQVDEAAAEEWLLQSSLSEQQRERARGGTGGGTPSELDSEPDADASS